eukprot:scaffold125963_cov69-Phaeocystis_antarctica.AAC.2
MTRPWPGTSCACTQSPNARIPDGNFTRSATMVPSASRLASHPSSTLTCRNPLAARPVSMSARVTRLIRFSVTSLAQSFQEQ